MNKPHTMKDALSLSRYLSRLQAFFARFTHNPSNQAPHNNTSQQNPNKPTKEHSYKSCFTFAYSVHWFFIITFCGIVLFIITFATDTQAILLKQSQMPLAELYNYDIYQTTNKSVDLHIRGQKGLRYADNEQSFETILQRIPQASTSHAQAPQERIIEYIYGQEIVRRDDIYLFPKGGVYAKNSGEALFSTKATYDLKNGLFTGTGAFWASSIEGSMDGYNLTYNQNTQITTASDITAVIDLNERENKKKKE